MSTFLRTVGFKLPELSETNEELVEGFPGWTAEKIFAKTGIKSRHILSPGQTPNDLISALCEDLIRENDQIDFIDLIDFAPSKPLHLKLKHDDGTEDTIAVNHTYNAQQIEWFKAGGALNLIRKSL